MTSPWTWGGLPTRTPVTGSTHLQNRPCWQIPVCYGAAFSLLGEGCGWQECLLSTASGWHGAMSSSKAVCGQFGYCSMGLRPGAHGCGAYAVIIIFWLRLKLTEPKLLWVMQRWLLMQHVSGVWCVCCNTENLIKWSSQFPHGVFNSVLVSMWSNYSVSHLSGLSKK